MNESGVAEQRAQRVPIKAQSTAVPVGTARICNAEWDDLGAMSGHGGFVHTLLDRGEAHRQIDGLHVLGEFAHRDAIDAGFCNGAHGLQIDPARDFEHGAPSVEAYGLAQ